MHTFFKIKYVNDLLVYTHKYIVFVCAFIYIYIYIKIKYVNDLLVYTHKYIVFVCAFIYIYIYIYMYSLNLFFEKCIKNYLIKN